jgi:signal transduction histidine kinase
MNSDSHAFHPEKSFPRLFLSSPDKLTEAPQSEGKSESSAAVEPLDAIIDETWVPLPVFLDAMQEAACGVDEHLHIRYWNIPMTRLTGVSREEALRRPLFSLLPRDFERHLETGLRQLFQQQANGHLARDANRKAFVEGEFSQRHGDSEFFDFSYRMSRLPTTADYALAIITLRVTSEGRRRQRQNKQQEHYEILGKLSASIAQELTDPLDIICNKIDNILNLAGSRWNQPLESELHSMISEVYRISHLVNNMLTLSRSRAPNLVRVDINHLILEALRVLEHTLNRKIACTTVLEPNLPLVAGDAVLLQNMLQNIFRHAVEAAGEDAVPRVQTILHESSPLATNSLAQADQSKNDHPRQNLTPEEVEKEPISPAQRVIIKIEDRGAALPPPVLAQLFEPFSASQKLGAGIGLGLFISKKIIESHRGQIQVSSEPGRGTIFVITLRA